ncbi:MAG: hypothetical protein V3W19_05250 [Desulfatiglandales bacterium]
MQVVGLINTRWTLKWTVFTLLIAGGCMLPVSTAASRKKVPMYSQRPIPDWATWKCEKPEINYQIIEAYECYGQEEKHISHVMIKLKGAKKPFLIGWGYDERALDPMEKAYAALYKDGRWIVGARGTGFTTEEKRNSITFYIFLDEYYSVREQIEIKLPTAEAPPSPNFVHLTVQSMGFTPKAA